MPKTPITPTTTVKINHQHEYSTLTIKLASGDTVRYTTSYSGMKLSVSAKDEWLKGSVGMNAMFKALEGMSNLAGETTSQRYERIKAVAERATRPYELLELLRAAETTKEQVAERRKVTFLKHCANDGLPAEMFGALVKINARDKGMINCRVEGYSDKGGGQIKCLAADGARYLLDPQSALRAYVIAHQITETPKPTPRDFSSARVPAPKKTERAGA